MSAQVASSRHTVTRAVDSAVTAGDRDRQPLGELTCADDVTQDRVDLDWEDAV